MADRLIDPERPRGDAPFDRLDGFSGQDYRRADQAALGRRTPAPPPDGTHGRDIPPDNGRRASMDERTGEVHGAGMGAGGGQPGEDFDQDAASGDGYPIDGSEGDGKQPGELGPAHARE